MNIMDNMKGFSIVVAATSASMGIGRNGTLPWRLSGDMINFKKITTSHNTSLLSNGTIQNTENKVPNVTSSNSSVENTFMNMNRPKNVVIMGRKTWESIPIKFRPLSDRINIILSKNTNIRSELQLQSEVIVAISLQEALKLANSSITTTSTPVDQIFVIGGGMIYKEAMESQLCKKIYLTEVFPEDLSIEKELDTFFPVIPAIRFRLVSCQPKIMETGFSYRYLEFESMDDDSQIFSSVVKTRNVKTSENNVEESQYLDIIRDILMNGSHRGDRTGTGTISKFGVQMRFSLRDGKFPLLTTKKVFWRGVAEELIWFVKGSTNANLLAEKGIHIWDGNGSREFLDKLGFHHRNVGDLGPVYGFQWRHFGAQYRDMHADYTGEGIDQLQECIRKIKKSPEDRRIIMTAWNPLDIDKMALPPCHMFCQFYVANGELSCQMYQRSADMGLGVPFNIASYSLLTVMMAQVCGLKPGDFVHSIGDAHIYSNHVDALQEQLTRIPRSFPTLSINSNVKDIDAFKYEDFTIENYNPYATIQMKMAV